jgi:hypothetical protein
MQQAEVSLTLKLKLLGQKTDVNIFSNKGQMRKLQPNELHLFISTYSLKIIYRKCSIKQITLFEHLSLGTKHNFFHGAPVLNIIHKKRADPTA